MRAKTARHVQLEILNRRMILSGEDRKDLNKHRLGFSGEVEFDDMIDALGLPSLIHLKDYRFRTGDAGPGDKKVNDGPGEIQIDNIIIAEDRLYTFEIKNYQYDMEYSGERSWRFAGGREIVSPLNQVESHRNMLTSMMREFNMHLDMVNNLVFIHPEQTIYNLPNHQNIYVRTNLMKRLKYLLKPNRYTHARFVEMLDSRRVLKSAYDTDANVTFEELAGGVYCADCEKIALRRVNRDKFICDECRVELWQYEAVQQLIEELRALNSTWKLSSGMISKYSGGNISSSTVRRYRIKGLIEY